MRPLRLAALLALLLACASAADAQPRGEYEIKAAYLFSFARFVEWPPAAASRAAGFTICVLGADPFGSVLDATLADAALRGRPMAIRRVPSAAAAADCHILFISASEERQLASIVSALGGAGILTVSDMPRFVGRGGMIQFQTVAGRVRFEIDLPSARDAGLMLSSDLLRVASAVRQDRAGGAR